MTRETHQSGHVIPNRLYMEANLTFYQAHAVALDAVALARRNMPKMTGQGARGIQPLWGEGFFGLTWSDDYIWFQEIGIHPFTMTKLAGKIIPMWIKDPTGVERRKNPKAKTQVGEDGVVRVLVFRRAAKIGQRKTVRRGGQTVDVPASYPGAPGRISSREIRSPRTTPGKVGGRIVSPLTQRHVGVRWRHPGLIPRSFLHRGIVMAAVQHGLDEQAPIHATTNRWR